MSRVRPFRALRPMPSAAADIAAVPYDVVSADEARALAAGNPRSFLHVSRAEIDLPPGTPPYSAAVYERALGNFRALQRDMIRDDGPAIYVYRLVMGTHQQTGVAAAFSLEEYAQGLIRKHEKTRRDKEDDRTRHLLTLRAQTGPVFLTYRDSPAVDALVAEACPDPPIYDFVAPDGIAHTVWRTTDRIGAALVGALRAVPALYIADGHHRAASAARAHAELSAADPRGDGDHAWFLAVAFPAAQTQILPYHRIVKDLNGRSAAGLLAELGRRLPVEPGDPTPRRKGECAMFLDGAWHRLALEPEASADAVASLDVSVLQDRVLEPLLGIGDVRSDVRIDFVGGVRGAQTLEEAVRAGRAAIAFSMYPVSVEDLMAIADAGAIMPPKSTWFEPKLRDGLLSRFV